MVRSIFANDRPDLARGEDEKLGRQIFNRDLAAVQSIVAIGVRKATMMPAAPAFMRPSGGSGAVLVERRLDSVPSARTRPANAENAVTRDQRVGPGAEQAECISGMRSRASSITSSNPAVVSSASGAPLRWMTVLMPTVVPWTNASIFAGSTPCRVRAG